MLLRRCTGPKAGILKSPTPSSRCRAPYPYLPTATCRISTSSFRRISKKTAGCACRKSVPAIEWSYTTLWPTFGIPNPRGCAALRSACPSARTISRRKLSAEMQCGPRAIFCWSTRPEARPTNGRTVSRNCCPPDPTSCFRCITQRTAMQRKTEPVSGSCSQSNRPESACSRCN